MIPVLYCQLSKKDPDFGTRCLSQMETSVVSRTSCKYVTDASIGPLIPNLLLQLFMNIHTCLVITAETSITY